MAKAHDHVARHVAKHARGDRGEHEAGERLAEVVLGEKSGGIRAEAEIRRVAERDDARVAEDEIERQREKRGDGDLAREREVARRYHKGQDRGGPEGGLERPHPPLPAEVRVSAWQRGPRAAT